MFGPLTKRVWRLGLIAGVLGAVGCGLTLTPPGFVHENRYSLTRGWFDFNSYRRLSFTYERYDHLPPNSARVKLFRWRHGGSVEQVPSVQILHDGYANFDPTVSASPNQCLDLMTPLEPNGDGTIDTSPPPLPPPPVPPSETQQPVFPEINSPNPESIDSVATIPTEPTDGLRNPIIWVEAMEEVPCDSACKNCSVPWFPPPPAPPAE